MKLLFVTELFWPSIGGVETRLRSWGEALVRQGHEVEVWCIDHTGQLPSVEVIDGIQIRRLVGRAGYKSGGRARRHWPTVFRFCGALMGRRKQMREFGGVVFGKWPLLPAMFLPLPSGVATSMDWCEVRSGRIWSLVYRVLTRRRTLRHIAIHAGISEWLQARGIERSRITVIGSAGGHPASSALPKRMDRSILFIGRLSEHKQPLLLLEAFASARLGEKGYVLNIAGSGPQDEAIAARARTVSGVIIHGAVSERRKFELLAEASLMALPSVREGFPVVMAEACTVGTPTLTIDAPDNGTAYVVRQLRCGWVCAAEPSALATAIETHAIISTPEWQACSAAAFERSLDTLSIEAQVRQLAAFVARPD